MLLSLGSWVSSHFTHQEANIQNLCDKNWMKIKLLQKVPQAPAVELTFTKLKYQMTKSVLGVDKAGHQVPESDYGNDKSNIVPFFPLIY